MLQCNFVALENGNHSNTIHIPIPISISFPFIYMGLSPSAHSSRELKRWVSHLASTEEDQDDRSTSASQECRLYSVKLSNKQWPIVYADEYNISFGGLERIHPFDSGQWGKIYKQLKGTSPHVLADVTAA